MRSNSDSFTGILLWPALVLAFAIPLVLGALPPFRFGYWDKAEPMIVWLHLCCGLGSLAVARCVWKPESRALRLLSHPFVLAPLLVALWSVLAAPFVAHPWLSLFGVPQSGLGALWFADTAVLTVCALLVRESPLLWRLLCVEAIIVTLAVAGLKIYDNLSADLEHTLLLYVEAYYGWIGVVLPVVSRPWQWRRRHWPLAAMTMLASLLCVYASHSLTAWGILVGGGVFVLAARFVPIAPLRFLTQSPWASAGLVGVLAVSPPFVLRALDPLITSASLRDRIHLQDMMLAGLMQSPSWLIGHGWGRVQDAFHANLNVTGENLWKPTWIFLSSDYFSSHNWLLDTLHAAGVPGTLLVLACFMVIPLGATPSTRPMATALAIGCALIGAVWFQLSFFLPFAALAMAAVARPVGEGPVPEGRGPAVSILIILAGLQLGAAGLLADFGWSISAMRREAAGGAPSGRSWPVDPRGSDLEAAELIRDTFLDFAKPGKVSDPGTAAVARSMMEVLATRIPVTGTVQLVTIGLDVQSQLHFSKQLAWLVPELPGARQLWRSWLDRLLLLAPGRTDQAIPYLTDRAMAGDLAAVGGVVSSILAGNPNDPVGLYFSGLLHILGRDPADRPRAIAAFRASMAAGIERFMPLDPVIRQLIDAG